MLFSIYRQALVSLCSLACKSEPLDLYSFLNHSFLIKSEKLGAPFLEHIGNCAELFGFVPANEENKT